MELLSFGFEPAHLEAFVALPWEVYRGDRRWIPPSREAVLAQLSPDHPFFAHGRMRHFLAGRREPQARVSAIINERLVEAGRPVGLLGFFESVDDEGAAGIAVETAVDWLEAQGAAVVRGPINTSTWHAYRFVTGGFEAEPFLLEPYNPPYYPAFFERLGFRPVAGYVSNLATDLGAMADRLEPDYAACLAAGYTFRPLDPARFDESLRLFYQLTVAIFPGNWGYSDITWEEFRALYAGMERLVEPRLIWFAFDRSGLPAGFVFGLPDYGAAVRRMNGERHFWAKLKFALARGGTRRAIFKTLGVLPEHRQARVGSALTHLIHRHALALGYAEAIHPLMYQDNYSRRISEKTGRTFREYAVYERQL